MPDTKRRSRSRRSLSRPRRSATICRLFRRASGLCLQPVTARATAGRNRKGETGYSHIVDCRTGAEGPGMSVDIGWSADPNAGKGWKGGPVSGVIAPDKRMRMRLVSDQGFAGLEPSAPPSTESIPNNHRAYAVQWFLFAGIALTDLRPRAARPPRRQAQGRLMSGRTSSAGQWPDHRGRPDRRGAVDRGRALRRGRIALRARRQGRPRPSWSSIWCSKAPGRATRARSPRRSRMSAGPQRLDRARPDRIPCAHPARRSGPGGRADRRSGARAGVRRRRARAREGRGAVRNWANAAIRPTI